MPSDAAQTIDQAPGTPPDLGGPIGALTTDGEHLWALNMKDMTLCSIVKVDPQTAT